MEPLESVVLTRMNMLIGILCEKAIRTSESEQAAMMASTVTLRFEGTWRRVTLAEEDEIGSVLPLVGVVFPGISWSRCSTTARRSSRGPCSSQQDVVL